MARYENLPGVNVEVQDGHLRVDPSLDRRSVLVIGTATSGTSEFQYRVTDSNRAANIFGSSSPLIKKMEQVRLGGARTVTLYRIGGKAASIEGIFGDGSYIKTVEETVNAGDNYSIYIGERPTRDGKACLIVFSEGSIVYSNVPGAEVDRRVILVEGFDPETRVRVGTPTEPVRMSQVIPATKELTLTVDNATGSVFALPETRKAYTVTVKSVKVNGANVAVSTVTVGNSATKDEKELTFSTGAPAGQKLEVEYSVKTIRTEEGSFSFAGDGTATEFDLPKTERTDTVVIKSVTVAGVDKTADATIQDGTNGKKVVLTTAPQVGEAGSIEYSVYKDVANSPAGKFIPGESNVQTTWKRYYELLHSAIMSLDVVDAFVVTTDKAIADAPNIASGSRATDRLDYVYITDRDGEYVYDWSEHKVVYYKNNRSEKTHLIAEADLDPNGQPIVYREYNEADFAHLLALFCYNISENEKFCLATIGTSTPRNLTANEINKWIGTPAEYDVLGNIVANGSGILNMRNLTERVESRQGYYYTSSGFVDGAVNFDSNGAPIDIGKYLSVVPAIINTGISSIYGTDGRNTNAAAVYAGLLSTIQPGNSATNTVIPGISLPFETKKTKLDQLAGAGMVMFQTKPLGVTCVSGDLATSNSSDFDYVSTIITVADVVQRIREVANPFIGKGTSEANIAALKVAVEGVLQEFVSINAVRKYAVDVIPLISASGKATINIPLVLVPAQELREVNVSVSLANDI